MKAQDFLRKGADLLEERGKQYDQPGGERSMGKAVSAFNTITGRSLYESEGWLLLQILKDVRQWQNPDKYHADSAEDCVSYAALKAEALATEGGIQAGWTDETIKAASFAHGGPISSDSVYLVGEQFDDFGAPLPLEPAASIDDDSERAQVVQQNGEMAAEVYAAIDGWIPATGHQPVDDFVIVEVVFSDGSSDVDRAAAWTWDDSDLTHYRIAKEAI